MNDHAWINGGQAKVAIESAKGLATRGITVKYFAACGPVDKSLLRCGVEVYCLNQDDILTDPRRLVAATRGLWNFTAARALWCLLKEHSSKDSIVHCHGYAKALSPAIGPVVTGGPIKHVYTMHEFFLVCPNGGFYDYQANAICTLRPLGSDCLRTHCDVRQFSHKVWRVVRQALLWSLGGLPRNLRDVIYISETERRAMAPYFNPLVRQHYVPNPVPVADRPRVPAENNKLVVFVGRLSAEKGGLLCAEATKVAKVPVVFVGDGPERAAIHAVNPGAVITGWVTPAEVESWLKKAACLIFPSRWTETFGLVAYEALALGIPVITGRWCAAAEAVRDGITGVVVDTPEVNSWVNAIHRVQKNLAGYSVAAHAKASTSQLGLDTHLDQLIDLYNNICNYSPPPA
ncbi:glycosyltransferase family 4 protein [Thiorhodovibrio litoralis]|uniref:glycosyltransferase family 4 protein n=1 Tax=Thiorhodovibrio litoralis TaxID=2952932 RepID=UPI002B2572CF|nr:glycosyltransferase family 4 protein [Thiorhodovibrio litoralis]